MGLTYIFVGALIYVMELTVAQVARQHRRSERFVQLALQSRRLSGHRRHGRMATVDDLAALAWARSLARGRSWSAEIRDAALDLLSDGRSSKASSSERSRLRTKLRSMSASQIAHAAGGLGEWARYRGIAPDESPRIGPSAVEEASLAVMHGQGWLVFLQTDDLDGFELYHDVTLDADGNLGVVERRCIDHRRARVLLDTYLLGDARLSAAAGAELERRARHV